MSLTWEQSGDRTLRLTLQDVQQLAIDSGFVFPNTGPELPLARRANLSALFERYQVNSASAFIRLFTSTCLAPPSGGKPPLAKGGAAPRALPAAEPAAAWAVQEAGQSTYIGQLRGGRRHGRGVLVTQGPPCVLYIGGFQEGLRHGLGEVLTSRGEAYQGYFEEDIMWGPARYTFPQLAAHQGQQQQQQAEEASPNRGAPSRARAKYEGLFNGRPQGKGVLFWEDGEEEAGVFDGAHCLERLPEEDLGGVLLVAGSNAQQARAQSEAIGGELVAQGLLVRAAALAAAVPAAAAVLQPPGA